MEIKIERGEIEDWKAAYLAALTGYCARPGVEPQTAVDRAMDAADGFVLSNRTLKDRVLLQDD